MLKVSPGRNGLDLGELSRVTKVSDLGANIYTSYLLVTAQKILVMRVVHHSGAQN